MVEAAAEANEELMNKYLEEGDLTEEEITLGLRTRTIASEIQPMLCGTAFKNKGVQRMLDAVIELMPSPVDIPPVKGMDDDEKPVTRKADDNEKFSALAFKLMTDPFVGQLTFVRVYSGVLAKGDSVYNPIRGKKERIGRIVQMHANNRLEVDEIRAGDIAACVGLKDVTTGETLCDPSAIVMLERMVFPEPVIAQAVEPKTKVDQEKMGIALNRLAQEDPSFRVRTDEESGQTIIAGMGELHLEIIVDRMKREFGVEANVGKPQVAYRETIRKTSRTPKASSCASPAARASTATSCSSSSRTSRARASSSSTPSRAAWCRASSFPRWKRASTKPSRRACWPATRWWTSRSRCTSVRTTTWTRTNWRSRWPPSSASRKARRKASPVILEPMMAVEVETPEDYAGNVMGDLSSRRGMVQGMEDMVGGGKAIKAEVPLSEMFGYSTTLRSMSQGRATYTMEFKHYSEAPRNVAEAIVAARAK
jgi:elongation factor G